MTLKHTQTLLVIATAIIAFGFFVIAASMYYTQQELDRLRAQLDQMSVCVENRARPNG